MAHRTYAEEVASHYGTEQEKALAKENADLLELLRDREMALGVMEAEVARLRSMLDKPYPIQCGPSVPWWVMLPHDAQSQRNHGQSIKRISERGGFSGAEAWCVVTGRHWREIERSLPEAECLWRAFAARINDPRDTRDPETIARALLGEKGEE